MALEKNTWTEKVRNEEVYLKMNEQKTMRKSQRKEEKMDRTYYEKQRMDNRNNRGTDRRQSWKRRPFMKQFIEDIGKPNHKELKVAVMDRDEWRAIEVI